MKNDFIKKTIFFVSVTAIALLFAFFINGGGIKNFIDFFPPVRERVNWRTVQSRARDTVVQVFVDVAYLNWTEPYKSPKGNRTVGSGFFIDDQGHILTNFHLVDESKAIRIQIPSFGKEQFDVEIVGVCPQADIALLKVTKNSFDEITEKLEKIPFLKLGSSDKVVRTQEVLALGYPLGQEKLKSTKGIVSGRERVWSESYIQMTAPINTGSSGGPSLNRDGEVIGINTAGVTGASNVGYIIPINDIKHIVKKIRTKKFLRKPTLGCEFNVATDEMVSFLGNPEPGGVYVARVYDGSLMSKAGVKKCDMLYKINVYVFDQYGEVSVTWSEYKIYFGNVIIRLEIGKKVPLTLFRNGKKIETELDFSFVQLLPIRFMYPDYEKIDYEIVGGMIVMELKLNHITFFKEKNPYLIKYFKKENQYGQKLILTHVFRGSQAKQARNIFAGDIIEKVNGKKVSTLDEFRRALLESKKTRYIHIESDKQSFVVLSLEKVLADENKLSEMYRYKKSPILEQLR